MTTVESQPLLPADDDLYDPDDVGLSDSPPLRPMKVNLEPSPSPPPAVPLPQISPESSPEPSPKRKGSNRPRNRATQGDAVLVNFMGGGQVPDVARDAGQQALPSDDEGEGQMKGASASINLKAIAVAAGAITVERIQDRDIMDGAQVNSPGRIDAPDTIMRETEGEHMEDVKSSIPSIPTISVNTEQNGLPTSETITKPGLQPEGELPPIMASSPMSSLPNGTLNTSSITLPSLSVQLGDINHLGDTAPPTGPPTFSQSPPTRPIPRFPAMGHSPPKSPNDVFRRELPSPGRGPAHYYYGPNSVRRPSQADTPYTSAGDYSSSNTETPSTDQSGSTPATMIDRMSIDGITNPQIGGFQCTYPGCNAQPFQTQVSFPNRLRLHMMKNLN